MQPQQAPTGWWTQLQNMLQGIDPARFGLQRILGQQQPRTIQTTDPGVGYGMSPSSPTAQMPPTPARKLMPQGVNAAGQRVVSQFDQQVNPLDHSVLPDLNSPSFWPARQSQPQRPVRDLKPYTGADQLPQQIAGYGAPPANVDYGVGSASAPWAVGPKRGPKPMSPTFQGPQPTMEDRMAYFRSPSGPLGAMKRPPGE
tara:strand:- start:738 stop:1334 length:597 start_codon:yes stop_codon:yes gene_type:complete